MKVPFIRRITQQRATPLRRALTPALLQQIKPPPGCPDFRQLSGEQMQLIATITERAALLNKKMNEQIRALHGQTSSLLIHETNIAILSMDIACVTILRGLRLRDFVKAEEFSFMAEVTAIEKNMVRERYFFSSEVRLRFASNGAILST